MKKFLAILLCAIMCLLSFASFAFTFNCWYSDDDELFYRPLGTRVNLTNVHTTSTFTESLVRGWVNSAINKWSSAGFPIAYTSNSSNANVQVYAGSPQTILDIYGVNILSVSDSGVVNVINGKTIHGNDRTSKGWFSVAGQSGIKNLQELSNSTITKVYILNKETSGTVSVDQDDGGDVTIADSYDYFKRTSTSMSNTTLHELGHALGFRGHTPEEYKSVSCMKKVGGNNESPSNISIYDKNHLIQGYNYYEENDFSAFLQQSFLEDLQELRLPITNVTTLNKTASIAKTVINITVLEKISGSDTIGRDDSADDILLTKYRAKVNNFISGGNDEEDEIIISSEVGNVLEVGKTYTVFCIPNKSAYYNQYILPYRGGVIEGTTLPLEAQTIINQLNVERSIQNALQPIQPELLYLEYAEPNTLNSFADVIVDVKIENIYSVENTGNGMIFDCAALPLNFKKGTMTSDQFDYIRLNDIVNIGNTYTLYLKYDAKNQVYMLAAREGAVVPATNNIE